MTETGSRARTRRAIIDAAVATLGQNPSASLSEIAARAEVGRTTVHRYFPERSDLMRAIGQDALERVAVATERARLGEGPALDAVMRLCQELFELGDILMLLFVDPAVMSDEMWEEETDADRATTAVIERGQAEGTIDAEAPPLWVRNVVWAVLYAAWEFARETGAPRHEALSRCLRTLRRALAA